MSQQQGKQTNTEIRSAKSLKVSNPNLQKPVSLRGVQFNEGKKRLGSKNSGTNSASRVFFHKRADRMKIPKYQNTYRLESFNPFNIEVVDNMVRDTMESKLSTVTSYHPNIMAKLCFEIDNELQNALLKKNYDRYKLVVQATIVQRFDQSLHAGFQCLWDVERDNYSYYVFQNNHIYAWCCVFAIYYE
ncbi:dynein light chain Tctex-type protein 2B-like [Apis laboriosa]|uniref:dynein light chain Tctex-type protein 2B-like n=1 Tax=Apis laboriosa TaxID=183418 RepID=UPI001CC36605|nr:dynein light chain Tctex-type protein 2B-like [Apis laboriosa]